MNLVKNRTFHPHLRDEEALVLENAVRLAIDSIINVLYGVNSARTHEYQRMVADRDKEIQRLECRLTEMEREVQVQRRQECPCRVPEPHGLGGTRSSADPQRAEYSDLERTAVLQESEISISLDLFARPPSQVSSQSHESALLSSPSRTSLEQSCTSHSSESSGVSVATRNAPTPPGSGGSSSVVVKEEPCEMDSVFVKWEINEEGFEELQGSTSSLCQDKESPVEKEKLEESERRNTSEAHQAEADRLHVAEGENTRNKKRSVPMAELPEEAQRLKRAAWRAASRRYYARKMARQQPNPSRAGPFPHIADSRHSVSLADKRRRALVSEFHSESLQREAWRAPSRRHYARKTAPRQTEPAQFLHLLQNMEPSEEEEARGASGGRPHSSSGGIMCS